MSGPLYELGQHVRFTDQTDLLLHSPLQKVRVDVLFPDLGTEDKNARRMSGSVVGPISSRESGVSNDILVEMGTPVLRRRVLQDTMQSGDFVEYVRLCGVSELLLMRLR